MSAGFHPRARGNPAASDPGANNKGNHSRARGNPVRKLSAAGARCLLLLFLILILPQPAPGQEAAGEYTLSQAFRDTLEHDARVLAAQNRVAEARERLEEVNSSLRPSLTISGNSGYTYNRNQARSTTTYEGHSSRGRVQLNQNLYTFGRIEGRRQRVEAEIAEAEYALEETRQEVLAETGRSFSEQVFRERILQSRRTFEELLNELEGIARRRIEIGALDRTELFEVLRRQHQARALRLEASSRYYVARAQLARLTGSDHEKLAPGSLAALELATPASLEYALDLAGNQSLSLLRARMRLEAAEGELAFRKAELWPTLSLEVNASTGNVGRGAASGPRPSIGEIHTTDMVAGVNLSMPLYEGGLKRSQLRGARLALETARWELSAEQEKVDIDVRSNWDLLQGLISSLGEFEGAVSDMEEVIELTGNKLDLGRATFVQYIEAQEDALEVEFELLNSRLRLDETRIALLRVLAALNP